jgi:hypothetical protein
MGSQLDLDQGGTYRQTEKVYLGPSVGWVSIPNKTVLPITAAGTYGLLRGMNLVTININGAVIINLPSSIASPQGPQAIPGQWAIVPVVIVDIGGFGQANGYQILPFGSELISGTYNNTTTLLKITSNFGAFVLNPILTAPGGWSLSQS